MRCVVMGVTSSVRRLPFMTTFHLNDVYFYNAGRVPCTSYPRSSV